MIWLALALSAGLPAAELELVAGGAATCVLDAGTLTCTGKVGARDFTREVLATDALGAALGADALCIRTQEKVTCSGSLDVELKGAFDDLALGADFGCALRRGELTCFGDNVYRQAGGDKKRAAPQRLMSGVTQFALGDHHGCAVRDGALHCWGAGYAGQRGDGERRPRATPQKVELPAAVTRVVAGGANTCAQLVDKRVFCAGAGGQGQLSMTSTVDQDTFVAAPLPGTPRAIGRGIYCAGDDETRCIGALDFVAKGATQIAAGFDHVCWSTTDALYCAGDNRANQLGVAGGADVLAPRQLTQSASRLWVSRGRTCGLDGERWCLGDPVPSGPGELLDFAETTCLVGAARATCAPRAPVVEGHLAKVGSTQELSVSGRGRVCARDARGQVLCDGERVTGGVQRIAQGRAHLCALDDGELYCEGDNTRAQLGVGDHRARRQLTRVQLGVKARDIALGHDTTCVVTQAGALVCFGAGFGASPARVRGVSGVSRVVVGRGHVCGIAKEGVFCLGDNRFGQLGVGDRALHRRVVFPKISDVVELAAGDAHTCALSASRAVRCWGKNDRAQIVNGIPYSASPVKSVALRRSAP